MKTMMIPEHKMFLYGEAREGWTPERVRAWLSKREESRWYGQCLADMLAQVWNQNGVLMHEFQADECTDEDFASWRKLVDELAERALTMVPGDPDEQALCPRLKPFMARYSYRDGAGWWVCDCDDKRPASVYTPAYESDGLREWVLSLLDSCAVKTHHYGDEGYEDIGDWGTYYEVSVAVLGEPLWIDCGEGEHLTIFYRGWHSHFEWYVNDLQWFEWMVGRFLAGDVAGLGLKDLDGNRIEN